MVSARARRDQVDFAVSLGASVRRACALMEVGRSALRYVSRMPARDAELAVELQRISREHAVYGHRFAWALVRRGGWTVNKKRVRRLWRSLGLSRRPTRKWRKLRTGVPRPLAPTGPNQVWAYDFVHDSCANGQKFKALTVVDEWTRECLAIEVGARIDAVRVIGVLEGLFATYGTPAVLRSDNGPEFIAQALRMWAMDRHSEIVTIAPGKPWQNASVESFNSTFREGCLDREWFAHLREARIVIEQWRWEYNHVRPHSSLGYRSPAEIGVEVRAAVRVESRTKAIAVPGRSLEATVEQIETEVHPITSGALS
jgi:putative transposase